MSDVLPEVEAPELAEQAERPFGLVVGVVLGGAFLAIAAVVLIVISVSSYADGRDRGQQAKERQVIEDASTWCRDAAADVSKPGSAHGSWDLVWIWGCERAIG